MGTASSGLEETGSIALYMLAQCTRPHIHIITFLGCVQMSSLA